MDSYPQLSAFALLQMVLTGAKCRHQWSKALDPQQPRIICNKCGLYAYAMKPQGGGGKRLMPRTDFEPETFYSGGHSTQHSTS